jgi:O-antigen/teichoic acid export membrane protein
VTADPATPERVPEDVLDTGAAGGLAIRGGALRVTGYLLGALLSLASAPLLVRHLGLEDFGRYYTAVSLVALVAGVTDVGLATVAMREYSVRRGADRDRLMRAVLGARLVLTSLGVLVAGAFAAVAGYGSELVVGTLVAGAGLVIAVSQSTLVVPLATRMRVGTITLIDLGRLTVAVLLTIAFVLAAAGIVAFLAIPGIAALAFLAVTVVLVRGDVPMRPTLRVREVLQLLRETLALSIATMLNVLYARLVIIVMSLVATAQATGYFSASYRVVEVLIGIPATLVATIFPLLSRAARDDHDRLRFALQRTLEVALLGGVGLTLLTSVGADVIMRLLGDREALPAAPTLSLLAVMLTPVFLGLTFAHVLLALRLHRELLVVNGIALVLVAGLAFALVPPLEDTGGALAVVIAEVVLVTMTAVALVRAHPDLRPDLGVVPKVAAALALALAPVLLLDLPDLVEVTLAGLLYAGMLVVLKAIPGELTSALTERLRPRPAD